MPARTVWIDTRVNEAVVTGTPFAISLMGTAGASQSRFDALTLTRTIIGLDVAAVVHDSGEGSARIALGIGVASEEAFVAGTLPDPDVDNDHPTRGWVWRAQYRIWAFAADQPAIFDRRVDLDIRAQRKLENGVAYLNGVNSTQEGAAVGVQVVGFIRTLWLIMG